ncbi:ATP-grasp domain-containing protein [Actinokineospora xionganensis]|uniref:ATP-grasp domain-containing protein n=1 Tax=Actinokineospora xionganensis TaxID=2684470 RepID=A0ABR7L005_9PSEU|nr:ATP-grasp domain-containing protein [Actinokineospora xionganensis]MBC6446015.1 ATP-grasp domain-containing protein [Actinokineospora xionganensis]
MTVAKPRLLLVDAPGGPQPEELRDSLSDVGSVHVLMVRWGDEAQVARRREPLAALGPVTMVARPDHVVEFGVALGAEHRFDGVIAFSELVAMQAGLLANLLAVPSSPPSATLATKHKDLQRALLAANGVPSPVYRVVRDPADLAACHDLTFPVILKPAAGVSSFCVVRAKDPAELVRRHADAVERFLSHPVSNGVAPVFLVEEEVVGQRWHADERFGTQVSVESIVHRGVCHHIGVTDKTPMVKDFREEGHFTPTALPAAAVSAVTDVATRAITAVGLTTGAVHTELMLTEGGPVVLEVNGRVGGSVYGLMKYAYGCDVIRAVAENAVGIAPRPTGPALVHAASIRTQPPAGRFRVAAVDDHLVADGLRRTTWGMLDKPVGTEFDTGDGSASNLARYVATAASGDELFATVEQVNKSIRAAVTLEPLP